MNRMQNLEGRLAIGLLVGMVALVPAWADFGQAMTYYKSGKFLEAAAEFQGMVDEQPDYADGHFMLGICFMRMSKPADAEKSFQRAIELNPDKFEYHYNLANAYQMREAYAKAVGTLNNAEGLATAQQKAGIYKLRGFALAAQQKWPEAVDDLERAVAAKPDGPTQTQLGKAYFKLGENQSAVTALRKAVKLEPDADVYELLAEALIDIAAKTSGESEKKARYGEALKESEQFLAMKKSVDAKYLTGRAALGAGQYTKAVGLFQDVIREQPGKCNAMLNLGKAHQALGDWANALSSLESATKCSPNMGLAWESKGFVLRKTASEAKDATTKQKKYNEAISAYEKAQAIKPSTSITKAIADCRENIKISQANQQMDAEELAQKEAEEQAAREFAEAKAKEEAWKSKQDDD